MERESKNLDNLKIKYIHQNESTINRKSRHEEKKS